MGEFRTLSFQDSVNAGAAKTLVSKRIATPFWIRSVQAEFALGHNGLVRIEVTLDNDPSAPADTTTTIGNNVFRPYSQALFLRGNNTVRDFKLDMLTPDIPQWIKVRANNTDPSAEHTINLTVQIELITLEEYKLIKTP